MSNYRKHFSTRDVTQGQKKPGSNQIQNDDGAYVWGLDDWGRLDRFLVLGSEGGSYYASERKLTVDNAEAVLRCIQDDGLRTVDTIVNISDAGRTPKNDPAIFALAVAAKLGDLETRKEAFAALPKVCRIPTHLFHFVDYAEGFGGWGRGLRRAVADWYRNKPIGKLAYHLVKYQGRDGWSNRDLLRLSHAKPQNMVQNELFHWAVKGEMSGNALAGEQEDFKALQFVGAFEAAKRTETAKDAVRLIQEHGLPREAIPTQFLNEPVVWEALLEKMPIGALLRNLGNLSKCGVLTGMSEATGDVTSRLNNLDFLRKGRIHPLQVLMALNTYGKGQGIRGKGTWPVVQQVMDALDEAFYTSFGTVEPTDKRTLICLDTSQSMTWAHNGGIAGMAGITPRVASAAMAMVTAAVEKRHIVVGWSDTATEIDLSPRMRMDDVVKRVGQYPAYSTNCAAPMELAMKRGYDVDTFILYTDSETNHHGALQPTAALQQYRDRTGIPAKLIVVGMVSNGFSIADPNDAGMLDVVGFDTAAPHVMSDFSKQ